ncbi:isopentenyl transferase family protein [Lentzea sp. JNUCC 0626]|uniref:isopentenyl transferase family protein n=1 Tax=Lentzea sp. JNUCC 0626 TaxID=3367513 RepID=UPI003748FCFC
MNYVHLVAGPTGAGKSEVAMNLADEHGAPVVVADRIQCYLDLPVTSARLDAEGRHHIAERTVTDGDYPTHEAAAALLRAVELLIRNNEHVIVEGGSLSLLRRFAACRGRFPFQLDTRVLEPLDWSAHLTRLRARSEQMLRNGMLDEIAKAWQHQAQHAFVASINGPEAVLAWCGETSTRPEDLPHAEEAEVAELAKRVALVHFEHSYEQRDVFSQLFGRSHSPSLTVGDR